MTNSQLKKASPTAKLTISAMLCAVGLILPQLFHAVGGNAAGAVFLPMHLPVFICGMLCGWQWGAGVGLVLPIMSSLVTGMPVMYPMGISMAAELCAYGAVSALLYRGAFKASGKPFAVYASLVTAMLAGRAVSGAAKALMLMGTAAPLTLKQFVGAAFVTAWPGIVIQLVLVPAVIMLVSKLHLRIK